jgi:hypothetical protein
MPIIVTTGGPIVPGAERKPILTIIQEVCASPGIGVAVPAAVFASARREHVEMRTLAIEVAERIAFDTHDWVALKTLGTLTGDGTTMEWALPVDYRRMLKKGGLYAGGCKLRQITDAEQWLATQSASVAVSLPGEWIIIGEEISVRPPIPTATEAQFWYVSSRYALDANGVQKTTFTADTDCFRLDARLLKLAMIWQWKESHGQPYAEDMANYETALALLAGGDRGSGILTSGVARTPGSATGSYPWPLG